MLIDEHVLGATAAGGASAEASKAFVAPEIGAGGVGAPGRF